VKLLNAHKPSNSSPACILALAQCREKGAKPTNTFGRRYLQCTSSWDAIRPSVEEQLREERVPARMIGDFCDGWTKAVSGADDNLTTLVWAVDFKAELARQLAARKAESGP